MELDQLPLDGATSSVSTGFLDYLPCSTATITASGFIVGSTIKFQVFHVLDAGADRVYGTLDDTIAGAANAAGEGHEPWTVTDGVLGTADDGGDLDGNANGMIVTKSKASSAPISPTQSPAATATTSLTAATTPTPSPAATARTSSTAGRKNVQRINNSIH